MGFGFEPQNLVGVLAQTRGSTWHHHEACVEAKLGHEERVAAGCTNQDLDHFVGMCNSSINKKEAVPNQPSIQFLFPLASMLVRCNRRKKTTK
jgi:hypothetical protein